MKPATFGHPLSILSEMQAINDKMREMLESDGLDPLDEVTKELTAQITAKLNEFAEKNPGVTPIVKTWLDGQDLHCEVYGPEGVHK